MNIPIAQNVTATPTKAILIDGVGTGSTAGIMDQPTPVAKAGEVTDFASLVATSAKQHKHEAQSNLPPPEQRSDHTADEGLQPKSKAENAEHQPRQTAIGADKTARLATPVLQQPSQTADEKNQPKNNAESTGHQPRQTAVGADKTARLVTPVMQQPSQTADEKNQPKNNAESTGHQPRQTAIGADKSTRLATPVMQQPSRMAPGKNQPKTIFENREHQPNQSALGTDESTRPSAPVAHQPGAIKHQPNQATVGAGKSARLNAPVVSHEPLDDGQKDTDVGLRTPRKDMVNPRIESAIAKKDGDMPPLKGMEKNAQEGPDAFEIPVQTGEPSKPAARGPMQQELIVTAQINAAMSQGLRQQVTEEHVSMQKPTAGVRSSPPDLEMTTATDAKKVPVGATPVLPSKMVQTSAQTTPDATKLPAQEVPLQVRESTSMSNPQPYVGSNTIDIADQGSQNSVAPQFSRTRPVSVGAPKTVLPLPHDTRQSDQEIEHSVSTKSNSAETTQDASTLLSKNPPKHVKATFQSASNIAAGVNENSGAPLRSSEQVGKVPDQPQMPTARLADPAVTSALVKHAPAPQTMPVKDKAERVHATSTAKIAVAPVNHVSPTPPPLQLYEAAPRTGDRTVPTSMIQPVAPPSYPVSVSQSAVVVPPAITSLQADSKTMTEPQSLALSFSDSIENFSWDTPKTHLPSGNAPPALRSDLAPHVARQLVEVMAQAAHKPVEIALSPQELGRVRMSVVSEDGTVTVNIMAERPETLDLMRRHIDQLGQTFRNMGYDQINFAFGKGAEGDAQTGSHSNDGTDQPRDAPNKADPDGASIGAATITLDHSQTSGVDIRL